MIFLPTVFGANGVCRHLIRPINYDPDGMKVRTYLLNQPTPAFRVVPNPDDNHQYEYETHFENVVRRSIAIAESQVDNNGVFEIEAEFDGVPNADGERDMQGNIDFEHILTCRILDEKDGIVPDWVGEEDRIVAKDCPGTSTSCSPKVCYQCLQFRGPRNKIYDYAFKFSNQFTESVIGKNIKKLYCYFHNKDVQNVVTITRSDLWFSSTKKIKLKRNYFLIGLNWNRLWLI